MNRYARQMILPEVGTAGQARLAQARVLVIGAGGLAAPVLPLLAGAGVGHITLVDGDRVSLSNLHRQTLFTEADCGQPKAEVAAQRCRSLNSEITVAAVTQALTPATAPAYVANADLVLDCADSYAVSYLLSDICRAATVPLLSASVLGLGGYVGGFCGGGAFAARGVPGRARQRRQLRDGGRAWPGRRHDRGHASADGADCAAGAFTVAPGAGGTVRRARISRLKLPL